MHSAKSRTKGMVMAVFQYSAGSITFIKFWNFYSRLVQTCGLYFSDQCWDHLTNRAASFMSPIFHMHASTSVTLFKSFLSETYASHTFFVCLIGLQETVLIFLNFQVQDMMIPDKQRQRMTKKHDNGDQIQITEIHLSLRSSDCMCCPTPSSMSHAQACLVWGHQYIHLTVTLSCPMDSCMLSHAVQYEVIHTPTRLWLCCPVANCVLSHAVQSVVTYSSIGLWLGECMLSVPSCILSHVQPEIIHTSRLWPRILSNG